MAAKGFATRWLPLIIILIALSCFYFFNLHTYISFESLKAHRFELLDWRDQHYLFAACCYVMLYIAAVAISIPGATIFTLAGGFLFGVFWGTVYVVMAATLGSLAVYFAVRTALEPWFAKRAHQWVGKMRAGFQAGEIQYLLALRLAPIFPFWAVNIAAALLGVRWKVFFMTTLIGIIPGSFVYVLLGNGLGYLFDQHTEPNLRIIFEPAILMPLIGLAVLSLLPVMIRRFRRGQNE